VKSSTCQPQSVSDARQSLRLQRGTVQDLFANWVEALRDLPATSRVFLARRRYRLVKDMVSGQIPEYLNQTDQDRRWSIGTSRCCRSEAGYVPHNRLPPGRGNRLHNLSLYCAVMTDVASHLKEARRSFDNSSFCFPDKVKGRCAARPRGRAECRTGVVRRLVTLMLHWQ